MNATPQPGLLGEQAVDAFTADALKNLRFALAWSESVGYGNQFTAELQEAIAQVEFVRGMLA